MISYYFLNLYPYAGYRFGGKKISFDLTAGLEYGYCFQNKEAGKATASNGIQYSTSAERDLVKNDIRSRVQVSANYSKMGLYIGYSYGLTQFTAIGSSGSLHQQILGFGLTYRIK